MSRKRKNNNQEEWRRYKKFEQENAKLRKEVNKLRSLVKELSHDRLQERLDRQNSGLEPVKPLCEICGNDDLVDVNITRPDGKFIIKVCNSCGNRSDMKKVKE